MSEINERISETTDKLNAMMAETRLQFDTLVTMQKDERIELQKMHHEEMEKVRKHYGKIIFGLIIALVLLLGGIIGSAIYVFSTYDFETVYQDNYVGGDGSATIYDGIHYNYS